jgi:hypothetical protein
MLNKLILYKLYKLEIISVIVVFLSHSLFFLSLEISSPSSFKKRPLQHKVFRVSAGPRTSDSDTLFWILT